MHSLADINNFADRCVKCGMCLQVCPTYRITQIEGYSPRGRISIIQGLLKKQLDTSKALKFHIDSCLQCRLCENRCPSVVPIVDLVQETKRQIDGLSPVSAKKRAGKFIALAMIIAPRKLKLAISLVLYLYQKFNLSTLLKLSGILYIPFIARLHDYLPVLRRPRKLKAYYPAQNSHIGNVSLFVGCVSEVFDPKTVQASISILTKLGFAVTLPKKQTCCGAVHFHQGENKKAFDCATKNIAVFNAVQSDAIINLATGCDKFITQYTDFDRTDNLNKETVSSYVTKSQNIVQFLASANWPDNLVFQTTQTNTAIHIPCTQIQRNDVLKIVNKIPNINITNVIQDQCCGAAGTYMMEFPKQSDEIRALMLSELNDSTTTLLTSNIGCALHLSCGLKNAKSKCQTLHPVILLDRLTSVVY